MMHSLSGSSNALIFEMARKGRAVSAMTSSINPSNKAVMDDNITMQQENGDGRRPDMVIDIGKPVKLTGGLEFSALTYTVIKKAKDLNGRWQKKEVDLLHHITGYAPKGCITAVMGPSGAGKSTFLDALAGRIASGSLMGRVSLDGADVSPSLIKRTSAYIMQEDRLFPMLTVYETLMFAADFRLGSISRDDKRQRVENLIQQLVFEEYLHRRRRDEGGLRRGATARVDRSGHHPRTVPAVPGRADFGAGLDECAQRDREGAGHSSIGKHRDSHDSPAVVADSAVVGPHDHPGSRPAGVPGPA
uniref:ABC transporter n=1 Tax=Salvia miltiorrhiza TaxID=226208 RepID=A0A8E6YGL0_SALMI|nr:ABC transporter [Salvia miltiorrhiza]